MRLVYAYNRHAELNRGQRLLLMILIAIYRQYQTSHNDDNFVYFCIFSIFVYFLFLHCVFICVPSCTNLIINKIK